MITSKTKLLVLAASALALASGVNAQVPLASNITASGFVAASWQHVSGGTTDHLDLDSALLSFTGDYKPVKGVVSLFYAPNAAPFAPNYPLPLGSSSEDIHLLDINATWDAGSGWTLQVGRFLSWMGYESFFVVNNPEITGANTVAGFIPGYEDGARVVYTDKDWNAGVALVDSAYNSVPAGGSAFKGDGELKKTYGFEAYFNYTAIKDTNLWFGISRDSAPGAAKAITTLDLYGQYQVSKELYLAAEYTIEDNVAANDSSTWLILADYTFSDQVSAAFRVSGDTYTGGAVVDDMKYTFAPTYTVSKNFSVRAEISYTVFDGKPTADPTFLGVQALFKF
jgi:hypothetical protein